MTSTDFSLLEQDEMDENHEHESLAEEPTAQGDGKTLHHLGSKISAAR